MGNEDSTNIIRDDEERGKKRYRIIAAGRTLRQQKMELPLLRKWETLNTRLTGSRKQHVLEAHLGLT